MHMPTICVMTRSKQNMPRPKGVFRGPHGTNHNHNYTTNTLPMQTLPTAP